MAIKTTKVLTTVLDVKYEFSALELAYIARDTMAALEEWQRHENDKGESNKHFASLIETARNRTKMLQRKHQLGYEMRPVECDIRYSQPERGFKQTVRKDSGEVVREEEMSPEEKRAEDQLQMFGSGDDAATKPQ